MQGRNADACALLVMRATHYLQFSGHWLRLWDAESDVWLEELCALMLPLPLIYELRPYLHPIGASYVVVINMRMLPG